MPSGISLFLRSVKIVSGAMQLDLTPSGPACAATSLVRSSMPAFAAA